MKPETIQVKYPDLDSLFNSPIDISHLSSLDYMDSLRDHELNRLLEGSTVAIDQVVGVLFAKRGHDGFGFPEKIYLTKRGEEEMSGDVPESGIMTMPGS